MLRGGALRGGAGRGGAGLCGEGRGGAEWVEGKIHTLPAPRAGELFMTHTLPTSFVGAGKIRVGWGGAGWSKIAIPSSIVKRKD